MLFSSISSSALLACFYLYYIFSTYTICCIYIFYTPVIVPVLLYVLCFISHIAYSYSLKRHKKFNCCLPYFLHDLEILKLSIDLYLYNYNF